MSSIHLVVAHSRRQIVDCQRLRYLVYVEQEKMLDASECSQGRELDARDFSGESTHLLVYAGNEPVGTVRLLQPHASSARLCNRLGLELESKFALSGFCAPGIVPAEVTRYCVLDRYRGTRVAAALFSGLLGESARRGITHWVAAANMQTDCADDAAIAYRLVQARKLQTASFSAEPREPGLPRSPARRFVYSAQERERGLRGESETLDLPRTLSLFATRLGALYMGPPAYDSYFNVFALPLVATLSESAQARAAAIGSRTPRIGCGDCRPRSSIT